MRDGLPPGVVRRTNATDLSLTVARGGIVSFKSAENPDHLYGRDVWAAVADEASRMREESWHALYSTLTSTGGPARLIGNVRGRKNWYYNLARKAEAGEPGFSYHKITVVQAVAAGVIEDWIAEAARRDMPEEVYKQLYMAEASDDAANPFGLSHIDACQQPLSTDPPAVWGWDLGRKVDWTVGIALDRQGRQCRPLERFQAPWPDTIRRIKQVTGRVPASVDSTGLGDVVVQELQKDNATNFEGYIFTLPSKQLLMEGLAVSIQGRKFSYVEKVIKDELESFEFEYTRVGTRYAAAPGSHDDTVCASALANERLRRKSPADSILAIGRMAGHG